MTSTAHTLAGETVGSLAAAQRDESVRSTRTDAKLIGALFLAGFLVYGVGSALVTSVVGTSGFLATITAHRAPLLIGAFLMLLNIAVDVGKGVFFFPILERHSRRTALAYLATMIVEVVLMTVGVLGLLMIVPLARQAVDAGAASVGWASALGSLAVQANTMAYQLGEMSLGFGCIFLCVLLFRTQLIPRFLALGGVIGYAILMTGAIAEIFGVHIGLVLSIPGGLFEVTLGIWLLSKGFLPEIGGQGAAVRPAPSLARS